MKMIEKVAYTPAQIATGLAVQGVGGAVVGSLRGKALAKDKKTRKEIGKKYDKMHGKDVAGTVAGGLATSPVAALTYNLAKRKSYNNTVKREMKKKASAQQFETDFVQEVHGKQSSKLVPGCGCGKMIVKACAKTEDCYEIEKEAEMLPTHKTGTSDRKSVQKDPETGTAEEVYSGEDTVQNSDVKNNILSKMIHI